jgi:hypothetical protein
VGRVGKKSYYQKWGRGVFTLKPVFGHNTLTPCIPLALEGEGEVMGEGLRPSSTPYLE